MADWTDGSDYAPTDPPMGFAMPRVEPLTCGAAVAALPGDGKLAAPTAFASPPDGGPALESLAPAVRDHRDPSKPFSASNQSLPPVAPRDPKQPFANARSPLSTELSLDADLNFPPPSGEPVVASAPSGAPGPAPAHRGSPAEYPSAQPASHPYPTAVNYPPPAGQPSPSNYPPPADYPNQSGYPYPPGYRSGSPAQRPGTKLTLGSVLTSTGWVMLGTLAVGVLFRPLSTSALVVAWLLSMSVKSGGVAVRRGFGVGIGIVCAVLVVAILQQHYAPMNAATTASQWVCAGLLFACPILVWWSQRPHR